MKTRKEILARIDSLTVEERAQLDRLEKEGRPEALDLDPTEKDQYEKRAKDIEEAESDLAKVDKFDTACQRTTDREERIRRTPVNDREIRTQPEGKMEQAWGAFLRTGESRGLEIGDNTKGGYLAPKEFVAEIIKNETEIAPFRGLARTIQTTRQSVQIPRRTAQFAAVWAGEKTTRSETDGLRYGLHDIPAHELVAVVDISNWALEDPAFNMDVEIQTEIAEQFAVGEATAFITGNNVAKPWGVAVDTSIANTNSGSNGDFDADDLIDLLYGLKGVYQNNATWMFNRVTLRKIRKLKANSEYIWAMGDFQPNNIARGLAPTILGRPYVIAPEMDSTGTTGNVSVIVGDYRRGYLIVDHVSLQVLRDPFTQAGSGTVRFWARRRVGGMVIQAEAIRRLQESA